MTAIVTTTAIVTATTIMTATTMMVMMSSSTISCLCLNDATLYSNLVLFFPWEGSRLRKEL
ncbi:Hypothetical protein FKW44_006144 [Caligus rogercresseyi]|uniref:Uncharacterized protein n=1 Tax=Caligus rogercresseyi TaxID=217165 RepID=A0A7T8QSM8_CALRO|nr:Hypothetical protein FKW44_006144 [Caligus rogercresseyi]